MLTTYDVGDLSQLTELKATCKKWVQTIKETYTTIDTVSTSIAKQLAEKKETTAQVVGTLTLDTKSVDHILNQVHTSRHNNIQFLLVSVKDKSKLLNDVKF